MQSTQIKNIEKGIGIFLFLLALIFTIYFKCPTNVQFFMIYTLVSAGIVLLLPKSSERTTFNNRGIKIAGGVAVFLILYFLNPIGSFKQDNCQVRVSTTVFVHGKKGKQDMILRQKGFVIMDLEGGERKRVSINENGQAFFQNLLVGDSVRLDIDFSEPYKSLYPDRVYVIRPNSEIYLAVSLQGIDRVFGKVLYNDNPLDSVIIQIDTLSTISDKLGNYGLRIPELMQKKQYDVWFTKKGFKTISAPAFPQTYEPLNIVMEKK